MCKDPHTYLFLDLTQPINDILRFRTKMFPEETTEVIAHFRGNKPVELAATLPSRTKPQARRALLPSAGDDLIKAIVDCAINTLNGNHKLSKEGKSETVN